MSIKNTPLNSKLTLIKATCKNFRSIGDEVVEINYAEHSNLLVSSENNGNGKSSLYLYLPYFAITGASYKAGDSVDSLINTATGKNLVVTLEFASAGKFFKVERTRKPNALNLYQLIGDEYIEIPNLPVASKGRQQLLYTLMNLDAKTAVSTLENSVLLGSKFNGFLGLSTPERRELIETVMDLGIFSSLNKETKALRGGLIVEQKQLLTDITNLELKEALAAQTVAHVKQDIDAVEQAHTLRLEILNQKVSDCTTEVKNALELDTEGSQLHCNYESDSEDIAKSKIELKYKLEEDLANLGEFKIDEQDSKLVSLEASYLSVDYESSVAKKQLKEKEDSLGEEINGKIAAIKASIVGRKDLHKAHLVFIESEHSNDSSAVDKQIIEQSSLLEKEKTKLQDLREKLVSSEESYNNTAATLIEAKVKRDKYQVNIDKMQENVNYLLNKKAVEDNALKLLDHVGVCSSCLQEVTEEYLVEARKDVQERLEKLQTELDVYYDRIGKGETAIEDLNINKLEGELESALYSVTSNKDLVGDSDKLYSSINSDLDRLNTIQADITRKYVQGKKDAELELNNDVLILKNELDSVEHEVAKTLGSYQAKLNQLLDTAPSRKDALLSQIDDRKVALKMEHGGKETNLRGVYRAEVKSLDDKLEILSNKLGGDLQQLVKDKEYKVSQAEKQLSIAKEDVSLAKEDHSEKYGTLKGKLIEGQTTHKGLVGKLRGLSDKYEKVQLDIEDYDVLLKLLSDQNGKASVVEYFLIPLNKNINKYLNHMGMYLGLKVDNVFNITLESHEYKDRNINSFSEGERAKINLALMLALMQISKSNSSVDFNLLVLDETLERLHPTSVTEAVAMLKDLFKDLNLVVITQRGEEFSEMFSVHKHYGKTGNGTKEIEKD